VRDLHLYAHRQRNPCSNLQCGHVSG
jgi:hypothetical protein